MAPTPATSTLQVNVVDGTRQPIPAGTPVLYTIVDGNQQQLFRDFHPANTTFKLPFYDNFGDNYTIVAFAGGYQQAGFSPVKCSPDVRQQVDLMLLKKNADFNFAGARWDLLDPAFRQLLTHGAPSDQAAHDRYTQLMENQAPVLACFFNIATAMSQIHLPAGTALQYFKELIWDSTMAQDRFFAYADPELYNQVKLAAVHNQFQREADFALFHAGATDSYKQIQFGEANVQLTFHANDTREIDGVTCIKMEPDIDYYKDLAAHALLEVVINGIGGSLTDPRQVYVLRWIAGRHAGVPDFNPPYVIV